MIVVSDGPRRVFDPTPEVNGGPETLKLGIIGFVLLRAARAFFWRINRGIRDFSVIYPSRSFRERLAQSRLTSTLYALELTSADFCF